MDPNRQVAVAKVVGGQALRHGMREDIGEAYTYLMNTWEPGDGAGLLAQVLPCPASTRGRW